MASVVPIPNICGIAVTDLRTMQSMTQFFRETTSRQKSCIDNQPLSSLSFSGSSNNFVRNLTPFERSTLDRVKNVNTVGEFFGCLKACKEFLPPGEKTEALCLRYCGQLRSD
jgi:hypothetical protein